jgi:hypothetical protein
VHYELIYKLSQYQQTHSSVYYIFYLNTFYAVSLLYILTTLV